MKRVFGVVIGCSALLAGCGGDAPPAMDAHSNVQALSVPPVTARPAAGESPQPAASAITSASGGMDDVIARVNGKSLKMRELVAPLVEAHGLTVLLNLVQLELARQDAAAAGIVVTPKDVEDERQSAMDKLFKGSDDTKLLDQLDRAAVARDKASASKNTVEAAKMGKYISDLQAEIASDREEFLNQFLASQHIDRIEFDIVLRINTYLRRIAEPQLQGKIDDAALHRAFGQMYGEKIVVRYIELANMDEVGDAKRRLAAGERFEDVAKDMSHNRSSADEGGLLPGFTRQSPKPPEIFKDMAFSLKDGQVSDPLLLGGTYILIKRLQLVPPKLVKFEDVQPTVYKTLYDKLLETVVKKLKQDLAEQTRKSLAIVDPVLSQQFKDREERLKREATKRARQDIDRTQRLRDLLKLRTTAPATEPAGSEPPANGPVPDATKAPAGAQPPAPEPGSNTFDLPRLPTPDTQPSVVPPGK